MIGANRSYTLGEKEGEALWFAGALMVIKAAGDQTDGRFSVIDQTVPGHYAVPSHIHHHEDEAWYVLEGHVTFSCGDEQFTASPGSWVFLPRDAVHAFKVGPDGARLLTLSAPAEFADFVRAAGEPATARTVPPPGPLDVEHLAEVAARYGIDIVGRPPA